MKRVFKKLLSLYYTRISLLPIKGKKGHIICNFRCNFTAKTEIGNDCHFNGMHISGNGRVIIGNGFHSGKRIRVITSFHDYDHGDRLPYGDDYVNKDVIIGDNVWIGEDVLILGGVKIGDGAIVQAGSVVCKDVPPLAVAGGHPAMPFKYRDKEHYYSLLKQKNEKVLED